MADNITVTSGSGVTIAADDNGGALHQWVKIEIGADGSFVPITTANGLPVQILSLPAFAAGSSVAITSLPDLGANSTIKITSLPDLGLGSTIKITSLPDLGLNSSVKITSLPPLGAGIVSINNFTFIPTITNLASSPLTVSGTTIAITSLPDLGLGSSVKVTSLPDLGLNSSVKITSLPDLGLNSVIKITSLPPLGAATVSVNNFTFILSVTNAGIFPISSLPSLAFGQTVTITNGAILSITNLVSVIETFPVYRVNLSTVSPISGYWTVTRTYTSATTQSIIIPLSDSTTAHHITDIIFSNAQTHGSFTLLVSRSNATIYPVLDRMYFRDYGGMVSNMNKPLVADTNSAILLTTYTATNYGIMIQGYAV